MNVHTWGSPIITKKIADNAITANKLINDGLAIWNPNRTLSILPYIEYSDDKEVFLNRQDNVIEYNASAIIIDSYIGTPNITYSIRTGNPFNN